MDNADIIVIVIVIVIIFDIQLTCSVDCHHSPPTDTASSGAHTSYRYS